MIVHADQLAAALAAIKPAVATRSTLPVLSTVLLRYHDGMLTLSASNLELWLSTTIEVSHAAHPFYLALPYAQLVKIIDPRGTGIGIQPLPDDPTSATIDQVGVATIQGFDPQDHPMYSYDWAPGHTFLSLKTEIPELLNGVVTDAAGDDSRPVLSGVHIVARNNGLYAEAADGFRLGSMNLRTDWDHEAYPVSYILPAKTLGTLLKITNWIDLHHAAEGTISPLYLRYSFTKYKQDVDVTGSMRTIDGNFPDLASIIPSNLENHVSVSTDTLIAAEKATRGNSQCALIIEACDEHSLARTGGKAHDLPDYTWNAGSVIHETGNPVEFAFQPDYGTWLTKAYAHEGRVTFQLNEGNHAIRVDNGPLTAIVMPMVIGHHDRR